MTECQDNRTRILVTAECLFAQKGYAATSVREILRGASVSGPTLYHYFGSKEELLVTLLRERLEGFLLQVEEAFADARTPQDVFSSYASLALTGVYEQRTTVRFLFAVLYGPSAGVPEDELRAHHTAHSAVLLTALKRVSPRTSIRRLAFVAALFNGMLNGLLMLFLKGHLQRADETLASAVAARAAAMLEDDQPVPDMWGGTTSPEEYLQ